MADEYRFRVTGSSIPLFTSLTPLLLQDYQFSQDGTYTWEIQALNSISGSLTSSRSLNIDTQAPSIPDLNLPENGSSFMSSEDITLSWFESIDDSPGLVYTVELSIDANFNGQVSGFPVETSELTIVVSDLSQGTYYWRVSSTDLAGNTSLNSSSRNFSVSF